MNSIESLPLADQNRLLRNRLKRSEAALIEAETVLANRMRELVAANAELERREASLVEALDIGSRQLLRAQSAGNIATIYGEIGGGFTTSKNANTLLGLPNEKDASLERLVMALHPLDRDRIMRAGMEFFTIKPPGIDHVYEHRIRRFDTGEVRWLRWFLRRERGTASSKAATYGTVQDITEARANARRVRALNLLAERRIRELDRVTSALEVERSRTADALVQRDRFLSEMAHAIRTPLATLTGAVDLLRNTDLAEVRELVEVAKATEELEALSARLLKETTEPSRIYVDPADGKPSAGAFRTRDDLPPRVLVAEDTESNRYVIVRQLTDLGCEIVAVENGVEAVEAVRRQHFDLVLMDVMMSLMTGEEATQAIRALPGPAARTPIVGVTAHSLQAERERLLASGMTACVAKPMRRETLETVLRTALIAGEGQPASQARFDEPLFQRAFLDLPANYRDRMREAVRGDLARLTQEFLTAGQGDDEEAISRAAHALKGVALNVGAVGIVEEMTRFRDARKAGEGPEIEPFRMEAAASLMTLDDLYLRLVSQ